MFLESLGARIRKRREERGLKQADISRAMQVSSQAVSKWERGENAPDISLLVSLARLLGVSVDWLLGLYDEEGKDVFDATVFVSSVKGYAAKSMVTEPRDLAAWANGLFYQLTEALIRRDGVPVKQMGDGLLGFFSGPLHQDRAVKAAMDVSGTIDSSMTIALCSGEIYLGSMGHPDYCLPDIMGGTVNIAFRMLELASLDSDGVIMASSTVVENLKDKIGLKGPFIKELTFIPKPVTIYEIMEKA